MKKQDLMKKKPEELSELLLTLKKDLFNLNSASLAGEDSLKKKARIKVVKRDIARINTVLNS
jgi:ribosomal protein L29